MVAIQVQLYGPYSVEWVGDDSMNGSEDLEGDVPGLYARQYIGFCLEQGE